MTLHSDRLIFNDHGVSDSSRAPALNGMGWYRVTNSEGDTWRADHSMHGDLGLFPTKETAMRSCTKHDVEFRQ